MQRCNDFLKYKSPAAARRAKKVIDAEFESLLRNPLLGRYWSENKKYREWIIPFGAGAYLALYSYDEKKNEVRILSFRHGKENAYFSRATFLEKE